MRKGRPVADFEPVYMENKALDFLRAWPDVPEALRPVYGRFYDAGLIWSDPNAPQDMEWPGALRLTALGHRIREVMMGKHINFFRVQDVFALLNDDQLQKKGAMVTKYIKLFKREWSEPDMRRYVTLRLTGVDPMTESLMDKIAKMGKAFERSTFHLGMTSWRLGGPDDLDNNIPF